MNDATRKAYKKVMIAITALMDLDPEIDSPEGCLLEDMAKACANYEESKRLNE